MRRIMVVAVTIGLLLGIGAGASAATAPTAPQNVVAHATAADEITVWWSAPASTGGGSLTYTITSTMTPPDGPSTAGPSAQPGAATSWTFTGLTPGTKYTFTVIASNGIAGPGASSAPTIATETVLPTHGTLSISGTQQYLQTLTAVPYAWGSTSIYRFQWSAGGTPIANATGVHFRIADPALVGQQLTVSMWVSNNTGPGYIDSAEQRASTGSISPAPLPGVAYIGGNATAGQTWYARTAGWPSGTTLTYQWTLDGQAIATTASYLVPNQLGSMVGLTVTATPSNQPGYTTTIVTVPALRLQPSNPLAGELWPADMSAGGWDHDLVWDYVHSTGTAHTLQAKIATRPRATWFGGWNSPSLAASLVKGYIAAVQNGNPKSLVTLTLHTIWTIDGLSEDTRNKPLTATQQADYKKWMTAVAGAIGTSRVAIIMEPDLAELPKAMTGSLNTADPVVRAKLVGWATQLLARNANAAIYLDSGDSDWQSVKTMVPWLKLAGIQYARGFALGATHYATATDDITYGTAMVKALTDAGVPAKNAHYVIDTADNGQGFTWAQYAAKFGGGSFNNAAPCRTTTGPAPCASLGVPPTWQVTDTALPLTASQKFYAIRQLDGYLWFSRPWLPWQSGAYSPALGQQLAASSPYA
ncbi:hypothetical protein Back2_19300 [Nocardioides baekrokdamisoli]|uniref:Glucanase n=1 Tax=Nocardioides baekrokdamisoli TaxID=1804624 RepID=A0A3G9IZ30_9ACTN|nr:glycoside hydrolase family 6 protein [Nocardioides baekrokdamisoli]BBH17643.1 hypothetical protein Back2_19300 [Nocardioides baekrokdamisoli]